VLRDNLDGRPSQIVALYASTIEPVRDGRTYTELVNAPFPKAGGSPEEYRAGIDRAIANGWLTRHESGTYVRFTAAGAALFA